MRNTKTDVTTFSFCFVKKGYNQTTPENKTIITQVDYEKCDPGFIKNKIDSGNHKVYFFIKMAEKKKIVPFTPVLNSLAFQRLMEKCTRVCFFLFFYFTEYPRVTSLMKRMVHTRQEMVIFAQLSLLSDHLEKLVNLYGELYIVQWKSVIVFENNILLAFCDYEW